MIIKEHQKKITANVGTVQHVEKPNVWVKTALYTVGETFAIYVLFASFNSNPCIEDDSTFPNTSFADGVYDAKHFSFNEPQDNTSYHY